MLEVLNGVYFFMGSRSNPTMVGMLTEIYDIMIIAVPVIIIVLSTVDFVIAIASDDEAMKKASKKLVKRLIIGVLFFLIPTILQLIFSWSDIGSPSISKFGQQ